MQRMDTLEEFLAVVKGFIDYVVELQEEKHLFICHPLVKNAVFFSPPDDMESSKDISNIPARLAFVASNDKHNWCLIDFEDMISMVQSCENYYIADLGFRVYIKVEAYMLEELAAMLSAQMPVAFFYTKAWVQGEPGDFTMITFDDWNNSDVWL